MLALSKAMRFIYTKARQLKDKSVASDATINTRVRPLIANLI